MYFDQRMHDNILTSILVLALILLLIISTVRHLGPSSITRSERSMPTTSISSLDSSVIVRSQSFVLTSPYALLQITIPSANIVTIFNKQTQTLVNA